MTLIERLRTGLIYGGGDLLATLITGQVNPWRMLGITLVGGGIYATENRAYFTWLDRRLPAGPQAWRRWQRAAAAWLWFNPLWIARHTLFIRLFSGRFDEIDSGVLMIGLVAFAANLLAIGALAFLVNLPLALSANYLIQNHLPASRRVYGSALFSASMAIYYALSEVWFA